MCERKTEKCFVSKIDKKFPSFRQQKITFCGILRNNFYALSNDWCERVQKDYITKYNNTILPALNNKPIEELTEQDVRIFIHTLECGSVMSADNKYRHRMLIQIVLEAAERDGLLSFPVWGNDLCSSPEDQIAIMEAAEDGRPPRSLTVDAQLTIFRELTSDYKQRGDRMALLLMFFCGLRNSEACGICFQDVYERPDYPGTYVLVLPNTVCSDHSYKPWGKTPNAPRIIPISKYMYQFIQARKAYIASLCASGEIVLKEGMTVDRLPIACTRDYVTPCNADQVTNAGRKLFSQINYDQAEYCLADHITRINPDEEDATSYLFRRNFCTDLFQIDAPQSMKQYLMGHKIEDPSMDPRYFTGERIFRVMSEIMHRRPLFNLSFDPETDSFHFAPFFFSEQRWEDLRRQFSGMRLRDFCDAPEAYMRDFEKAVLAFNAAH